MIPAIQNKRYFISRGADLGLSAARLTSLIHIILGFLILDFDFLHKHFQDLSNRGKDYYLDLGWLTYTVLIEIFVTGIIVFFAMLIGIIVGALLGLLFSSLGKRMSPRGFTLIGLLFCLALMLGFSIWVYPFDAWEWENYWFDKYFVFGFSYWISIPQLMFIGCGGWVSHQLAKNDRDVPMYGGGYATP